MGTLGLVTAAKRPGKAGLTERQNANLRKLLDALRAADKTWTDARLGEVANIDQSAVSRFRSGGGSSLESAQAWAELAGVDLMTLLDSGSMVPVPSRTDLELMAAVAGGYSREVYEAAIRMLIAAPIVNPTREDLLAAAQFYFERRERVAPWTPPRVTDAPRRVPVEVREIEASQAPIQKRRRAQ